eukprot:g6750.t1
MRGDAVPVVADSNGVGQKCPWWQLDLGATKKVDKVKLSATIPHLDFAADTRFAWMRRLLFVEPMAGPLRSHVRWNGTDMTGGRPGGVRVLVGNSARNRADTSVELADGRWSGNAVGSICPEPAADEVCETIQCDDAANCLDRFAAESSAAEVGTAEVNCNDKRGRYVTIELPGVTDTANDTGQIRTAGLTEVRVEGTSTAYTLSEVPKCEGCGPDPHECWGTCGGTTYNGPDSPARGYCDKCNSTAGSGGACCRQGNPDDPHECHNAVEYPQEDNGHWHVLPRS